MAPPTDFSLIIPAYNEEARLPETIARVAEECGGLGMLWEAVIVVEKSGDRTAEIAAGAAARQANFRAIANPVQRGKGYAVKTGMLAARGAIRFYMDADLSVPLRFVPEFLRRFEERPGTDCLWGSRKHPGSLIRVRQSWVRRTMGAAFNRILRAALRLPVGMEDTQCGFKAFRAEAAEAIFSRLQTDGFAFDVELLLLAKRLGHAVEERPVEWANSPQSKVRIVRDSLRMLREARAIGKRLGREGGGEGNDTISRK